MHRSGWVLVLAWSSASADSRCAKLEPIAKLYETYAAEAAASPAIAGLGEGPPLVTIAGKPTRIVDADFVSISATDATVYAPDGTQQHGDASEWRRHGSHLVIGPSAEASWAQIQAALRAGAALGYADIALAYAAFGTLHGRKVPETPEANAKSAVDLGKWGAKFDQELAAHCPELEKLFARQPVAAASIAGAVTLVRGCSCEIDVRYLEQWPWLIGERLVTTVPVAAKGSFHAKPDARWADLVKASAGKAVPVHLEPVAPPPPPPPPKR